MNRFRALILGFATAASAAALAAYSGVFDGPQKPASVSAAVKADAPAKAAEPAVDSAAAKPAAPDAAKSAEAPVEVAKADPAAPAEAEASVPKAAAPAAKTDAPAAIAAMAPEFGLLRAEPDGSLLVAGKGAPNADIELVTGDTILGKTKAAANGDFAIVLSDPLKAGDYSMVLRTTNPNGTAATSVQTAIVSIPQDLKGEVLAMVEEAGKASRIITAPQAAKPVEAAAAEPAKPDAGETVAAATPDAPAAAVEAPKKVTIPLPDVAVEAVEIEGNKIFVAGSAPAGSTIRIYATEMLLGETKATANDRFLLEASRDLAVGDYFIHADTIGPDGKLISRVTVPFTREAGEKVVAVAPADAAKKPAAAAAETAAKAPGGSAAEPAKAAETAKAEPSAAEPQSEAAAKAAEPAAEDVTLAPALTKADASVIIRRGDSLWRISKRVYGRGVRYSTIYLANKEKVRNPNRIWPGQVMMIPEKTSEGEAADMVEVEKRNKAAKAQ
jgi:nucleoid-associated protein YgaU